MTTQPHTTLYDAIRGHEDHLRRVVHQAVESALIDLGDDVRKLDWANVCVSLPARV
jgi:hypothetical protein